MSVYGLIAIMQTVILAIVLMAIIATRRIRRDQRRILDNEREHLRQHRDLNQDLSRWAQQLAERHYDLDQVEALREELQRHTTSNLLHADADRKG